MGQTWTEYLPPSKREFRQQWADETGIQSMKDLQSRQKHIDVTMILTW